MNKWIKLTLGIVVGLSVSGCGDHVVTTVKDEKQRDRFTWCSMGISTEFRAEAKAVVAKAKVNAEGKLLFGVEVSSKLIPLFPEKDRLEAYKVFVSCMNDENVTTSTSTVPSCPTGYSSVDGAPTICRAEGYGCEGVEHPRMLACGVDASYTSGTAQAFLLPAGWNKQRTVYSSLRNQNEVVRALGDDLVLCYIHGNTPNCGNSTRTGGASGKVSWVSEIRWEN